jgi:hypothetical protein
MTVNKAAPDADKDDIIEESSCSESRESGPGSSPEGNDVQEDKEMKDRIIKTEERNVQIARFVIIGAVIAIAVAVSTAVYLFANKSDQDSFELEVSNKRHLHCCRIVISTNDVLTLIPSLYYLMPCPSV